MATFHYRFATIDGTFDLVSQLLNNDSFTYKDYNWIKYLSIEISKIDKIIILDLQIKIEEVSYWGYYLENLGYLFAK